MKLRAFLLMIHQFLHRVHAAVRGAWSGGSKCFSGFPSKHQWKRECAFQFCRITGRTRELSTENALTVFRHCHLTIHCPQGIHLPVTWFISGNQGRFTPRSSQRFNFFFPLRQYIQHRDFGLQTHTLEPCGAIQAPETWCERTSTVEHWSAPCCFQIQTISALFVSRKNRAICSLILHFTAANWTPLLNLNINLRKKSTPSAGREQQNLRTLWFFFCLFVLVSLVFHVQKQRHHLFRQLWGGSTQHSARQHVEFTSCKKDEISCVIPVNRRLQFGSKRLEIQGNRSVKSTL